LSHHTDNFNSVSPPTLDFLKATPLCKIVSLLLNC